MAGVEIPPTDVGSDDGERSWWWAESVDELLAHVDSSPAGLTSQEAARRLDEVGPNRIGRDRPAGDLALLARQLTSPIVVLLIAASVLSAFLGDQVDATIILTIIGLSALLGFWQERNAVHAVRALLASVRVHSDVVRDGRETEVALEDVVPGDVVILRAGDVVPADARIIDAQGLQVDEATLTGETYPVHKEPGTAAPDAAITGRRNAVFLGTHVVSGDAVAIVAATGARTELGQIGGRLGRVEPPTSFERGLTSFGYLILRVGGVLIAAVFVVNVVLDRPVIDSLLFSLALAVGITPQLLPAIVTLSLSIGARRMARRRVVVKRLSSIEDFGGMDVLCVDKTGTITQGAIRLEATLDVAGSPSETVRTLAWCNARHQAAYPNPIDAAILSGSAPPREPGRRLGEVPFDFTRKRLSVAVVFKHGPMLITKGALEQVLAVCEDALVSKDRRVPIADVHESLQARFRALSDDGLRVLAVAQRFLPARTTEVSAVDERGLTFVGLLAFSDPPKQDAAATIRALGAMGVSVRMITGDNRHAAAHAAAAVGLDTQTIVTGDEIDRLDDRGLAARVDAVFVFAEVEPAHKERLVVALSHAGHTVGFLGDGINDAVALHAADVGISVNTAVDVAKDSAAIVLLDKDLAVLLDGAREGRRTFVNTLKYVFVTTSANFGNVLSMAGGTLLLPFLPLLPRQILLLNLLSDIPGTTIAEDTVDTEQVIAPTRWDIGFVRNFMITFGLISSAFDFLTFAVLRWGFDAAAPRFRTGWFLVSVGTELAVMLVLRTRRPFLHSRPATPLLVSSIAIAALTTAIPFLPFADDIGFRAPDLVLLLVVAALITGYVITSELTKRVFYARTAQTTRR